MDWWVTVWFKVVQHVWMEEDFYICVWKPLCTLSALRWTFIMATVISCLTTSVLGIGMHTNNLSFVISWNKHWEIVQLKKEKRQQKMVISFKKVNRNRKEQNELYCLGTLKNCWNHRLLFSLSFHAGLSRINNLCNILSQSVHSNSPVATGI